MLCPGGKCMLQFINEQDLMFWEGLYEVQRNAVMHEVLSECVPFIEAQSYPGPETLNDGKMHFQSPLHLKFREMAKPYSDPCLDDDGMHRKCLLWIYSPEYLRLQVCRNCSY